MSRGPSLRRTANLFTPWLASFLFCLLSTGVLKSEFMTCNSCPPYRKRFGISARRTDTFPYFRLLFLAFAHV